MEHIVIILIVAVVVMWFLKLSKKLIGLGILAVIVSCILRYFGVI